MQKNLFYKGGLLALLLLLAGCGASKQTVTVTDRPTPPTEVAPDSTTATAQAAPIPMRLDTVQAGRFDAGKMWTFDNPPLDYFQEAYGFRPDQAWFERARLGALRFSAYCSASFVTPNGLVMTNHHCARQSVTDVTKPGEALLDNGFYAASLSDERKAEDLYVDQLTKIEDVTDKVYAGGGDAEARRRRAESLEKRMTTESQQQDSTFQVEVIELYNGGKYSAYTFRRYKDVRLVMVPELKLGFFGGDPDNFTYPRYAFDASFFRVYDPEGKPLQSRFFFPWSSTGAREGEAVFVVGNPGSTSRLSAVSQLAYQRDFALPQELALLNSRAEILKDYIDAHPDSAEAYDLRNTYFSITNTIKSKEGQLEGLRDPYLIARRDAAERKLAREIAANDSLRKQYGDVLQEIEALQRSKEATHDQASAFTFFTSSTISSHILTRAAYGYLYAVLKQRMAPQETLDNIRKEAGEISDWPPEVEKAFIAARFNEFKKHLGADDLTVRRTLEGRTPEAFAEDLVNKTALGDSAKFAALLDKGYLGSGDPTVPVAEALVPVFLTFSQQIGGFEDREQEMNARLARARFALEGTAIPPDASFSLRIADGVVKGYDYNGTQAPAHTTFYGLYNKYYVAGPGTDWDLPERWLNYPSTFDLSTPLNLVTTADITGGNSGSPLLNKDLEVVGLVFDSNIEALPNEFLYRDDEARSVAVDVRGILEALDEIYDADRLVVELTSGRLVSTEAEADAVGSR